MSLRIGRVIARGWEWLVVRVFYNEHTIAKYFRKQGARIGSNVRILTKTLGSEPYLVRIGNNVLVSSQVMFCTHDGGVSVFRREIKDIHVFGTIDIKDSCMIGTRSVIMPGVTIGPNSIVGVCSLVNRDVPPNTVVAGMPARVFCPIDDYKKRSVERFKSLNLHGDRRAWKEQLIKHFWGGT